MTSTSDDAAPEGGTPGTADYNTGGVGGGRNDQQHTSGNGEAEQEPKSRYRTVIKDGQTWSVPLPGVFKLSVLTCRPSKVLRKTILADGTSKSYDLTQTYRFEYHEVVGLDALADLLRNLATEPCKAIIRGCLKDGFDPKEWWWKRIHDGVNSRTKAEELASVECDARSWIDLDLDGVPVPSGLGQPDKVKEAALYIRDHCRNNFTNAAVL
jgi:hypothetical protein